MITPNIIIIYNWFSISHKILWLYYINLHRREAFLGLYGPTITWQDTKEQKNGVMRMWRPLSNWYNRPWNLLLQFSSCTIYYYQMPIKFVLICYQAAYHNIHVYLYKEITIYIFISWDFQMLILYNPSNFHYDVQSLTVVNFNIYQLHEKTKIWNRTFPCPNRQVCLNLDFPGPKKSDNTELTHR